MLKELDTFTPTTTKSFLSCNDRQNEDTAKQNMDSIVALLEQEQRSQYKGGTTGRTSHDRYYDDASVEFSPSTTYHCFNEDAYLHQLNLKRINRLQQGRKKFNIYEDVDEETITITTTTTTTTATTGSTIESRLPFQEINQLSLILRNLSNTRVHDRHLVFNNPASLDEERVSSFPYYDGDGDGNEDAFDSLEIEASITFDEEEHYYDDDDDDDDDIMELQIEASKTFDEEEYFIL